MTSPTTSKSSTYISPILSSHIRCQIFDKIINAVIDMHLIDLLCPNGKALDTETSLFDFKLKLPLPPLSGHSTQAMKEAYAGDMCEIVKDAVAFHNSYGGYIIAGVDNTSRTIKGFSGRFACDDLNKKIQSVTDCNIECTYERMVLSLDSSNKTIGVLHIPRRLDSTTPVKFCRDASAGPTTKAKAFSRGQVFFRERDQSKPAISLGDYEFILSKNRRYIIGTHPSYEITTIHNNLPLRDPSYVEFVGRDNYLERLWIWLFNTFDRVKVLTGLGGIGKTSIARKFCDDLIKNSALGLDAVIWLSAKKRTYSAIKGQYIDTARLDFIDRRSLYTRLLSEVGCPDSDIRNNNEIEMLIKLLIDHLSAFPCFIIIDDLDSLPTEEQRYIFQEINIIANRVYSSVQNQTRFLITARLELGASPAQLIKVAGMEREDFCQYVNKVANSIDLKIDFNITSKNLVRFHEVSSGSPMFANSVLRLVSLGEPLEKVLRAWTGADGEEVRTAAFGRELSLLQDSAIRTLFAACQLAETTFAELLEVTESSLTLLRDDIESLKNFHFLALTQSTKSRSMRLSVPDNVRLMDAVIQDRIRDPRRIERACARSRKNVPTLNTEVGMVINRVVGHWKEKEFEFAVEVCEQERKRFLDHPDFRCITGQAYLKVVPPRPKDAEHEFREAFNLGCQRPELFEIWMEAKELLSDWIGIIEVSKLSDQIAQSSGNVVSRGHALLSLGNIGREGNRYRVAAERYLEGAEEINRAFLEGKAVGRVADLQELQRELMLSYVHAMSVLHDDPNEHLYVWHAVFRAFQLRVIYLPLLDFGVRKLESWWCAVEIRQKFDQKAANLLEVEIDKRLMKILYWLNTLKEPPPDLSLTVNNTINDLRNRVSRYQSRFRYE